MSDLGSWFPSIIEALRAPRIVEQELQRAEERQCLHADSDWKAVRSTMALAFEKDLLTGKPIETDVVIQWCTICREWEVITIIEYNARRSIDNKVAVV